MFGSWWPVPSILRVFGRFWASARAPTRTSPAGRRFCVTWSRGLKGVQLIISDACRGLTESAAEYLPEARWQRCMVHFYRNVFSHVPATKVREVRHMLKAIHAQESRDAADRKARAIVVDLRTARMNTAPFRRAERVRNAHLLRLPDILAEDTHQQPAQRIMREFVGGPVSLERSPTASHASTWRPRDCATSSAPHGPPSAT